MLVEKSMNGYVPERKINQRDDLVTTKHTGLNFISHQCSLPYSSYSDVYSRLKAFLSSIGGSLDKDILSLFRIGNDAFLLAVTLVTLCVTVRCLSCVCTELRLTDDSLRYGDWSSRPGNSVSDRAGEGPLELRGDRSWLPYSDVPRSVPSILHFLLVKELTSFLCFLFLPLGCDRFGGFNGGFGWMIGSNTK